MNIFELESSRQAMDEIQHSEWWQQPNIWIRPNVIIRHISTSESPGTNYNMAQHTWDKAQVNSAVKLTPRAFQFTNSFNIPGKNDTV